MKIHMITNAALALVAELQIEREELIKTCVGIQDSLADTKKKLSEVAAERLALLKEKEGGDDEPEAPTS